MKTKLDEIDRQIIRYKRQGFSNSIIAYTLGVTKANISYRTKIMRERFGLNFYKDELDEKDKLIIELKNKGYGTNLIASIVDLNNTTVSNRIAHIKEITGMTFPPKKRFLDDLDEQIHEDFSNGLTGKEIADKYNLSASAVSRRKKKIEEVLSIEIPIKKIDEKDEQIKKLQEEENLKSTQIGERIGMSGQAVRRRMKKIQKIEKRELAKMIVNLINTKQATIEQVKKMGEYYGVDVEEILNSFDEQER